MDEVISLSLPDFLLCNVNSRMGCIVLLLGQVSFCRVSSVDRSDADSLSNEMTGGG